MSRYKYTDKELKQLLRSLVILVDTREQKNRHITDWFDKNNISYKSQALSNGDYSVMIPKCEELNIMRDLYFDKECMIERKRNLDEIGSNFSTYRTRFEEELATYSGKKYLLIENASYMDLLNGKFRNELSVKSFIATLHTFNHRYNIEVFFNPQDSTSGAWIYYTLLYYIREQFK